MIEEKKTFEAVAREIHAIAAQMDADLGSAINNHENGPSKWRTMVAALGIQKGLLKLFGAMEKTEYAIVHDDFTRGVHDTIEKEMVNASNMASAMVEWHNCLDDCMNAAWEIHMSMDAICNAINGTKYGIELDKSM